MNATHSLHAGAGTIYRTAIALVGMTLGSATVSHAQVFHFPGLGAVGSGATARASGTAQSTGATQSAAAFQASGAKPLSAAQLLQLFDFNKNGKMDQTEISLVHNALGVLGGNNPAGVQGANAAAAQAAVLKQFDANQNGKLDLAEAEFATFALSGLAALAGRPISPLGTGLMGPNGMGVGGVGAGAVVAGAGGAGGAGAAGQVGNGKVPKGAADKAPASPAKKKGKSKRAAQLLADFDKNRDGKLDAEEREAAKHAGSSATAKAKPREPAANGNKPREPVAKAHKPGKPAADAND